MVHEPGARVSTSAGNGTVRFTGNTEFAPGVWVGVELDSQTGKNDGSVAGKYYFESKAGFGLFVRPTQIRDAPVVSIFLFLVEISHTSSETFSTVFYTFK